MKPTLFLFTFAFFLLSASFVQAQSPALQKNTQWLEKMLNTLVKEDNKKSGEKETKPDFKFTNCQMAMNVVTDNKEDNFSMGFHLNWLLKDVTKVSYKKEKDGNYTLMLNVPPDKMKMDMGFGNDNSISGSFNMKDEKGNKKDDDNTSLSLSTKDEKLVQEMVRKFEESIKLCKGS
ncbi:hypothetical protein QNI16_15160 [Cytophagaceae bacterium YF14B1]|uniref:DUF4468 domain-containing protein n=1 Tax=Xanthocytophaga flava TaxID=3048013 RepID=A0AAE3QSF8_9BACT|nr:hypothetical protein [Xanthocytophaga flavus]MDJ1481838.1 hypothetical protein [Xanthocytophaga flavus]